LGVTAQAHRGKMRWRTFLGVPKGSEPRIDKQKNIAKKPDLALIPAVTTEREESIPILRQAWNHKGGADPLQKQPRRRKTSYSLNITREGEKHKQRQ